MRSVLWVYEVLFITRVAQDTTPPTQQYHKGLRFFNIPQLFQHTGVVIICTTHGYTMAQRGRCARVLVCMRKKKSVVSSLHPHHSLPPPPLARRRDTIAPRNDTEKRVYEALSNKNWGASSTLLNDIARDTYDL